MITWGREIEEPEVQATPQAVINRVRKRERTKATAALQDLFSQGRERYVR